MEKNELIKALQKLNEALNIENSSLSSQYSNKMRLFSIRYHIFDILGETELACQDLESLQTSMLNLLKAYPEEYLESELSFDLLVNIFDLDTLKDKCK